MTEVPSIVVLGIGNTLMQDDGIGVRAVRALAEAYEFPTRVRLVEGGTAGLRLLSELEGVEHLLIIDAVSGKEQPGSIYRLTPKDLPKRRGSSLSAHEVGMAELLSTAELIGKRPRTRILGVQPMEAGAVGLELTPPLQKALPFVVSAAVEELKAMGVEMKTKVDLEAQPS
jgi:hydrogenase maturation protease